MTINITDYIVPAIAAAVFMFCYVLHEMNFINNKYLPLIAAALGIVFNFWVTHTFTFETFLSGMASGLSATGIDQAIKSLKS